MNSPNQKMRKRLSSTDSAVINAKKRRSNWSKPWTADVTNDSEQFSVDAVSRDVVNDQSDDDIAKHIVNPICRSQHHKHFKTLTYAKPSSKDDNDGMVMEDITLSPNKIFPDETSFYHTTPSSKDIDSGIQNMSSPMNKHNPGYATPEEISLQKVRLSKIAELRQQVKILSSSPLTEDKCVQTDDEIHMRSKSILNPRKRPNAKFSHTLSHITATTTIEPVAILEQQVVENVLHESRCLCCDVQHGLSLAFMWFIMCTMPYKDITQNWFETIIGLIVVSILFLGIIGIWKGSKTRLYVCLVGILFNTTVMFIRMISLVHMFVGNSNEFFIDAKGPFYPPFIELSRHNIERGSKVWIQWVCIVIFNMTLQGFIIWNVRRALKAIQKVKDTFQPKRNISQISL